MRALILLMLNLPWWADLAIIGVLAILVVWLRFYIRRRFDQIVHETVLEVGAGLKDAAVTVHCVEAVTPPADSSPYDLEENDENFMEGVDDEPWDDAGVNYYSIEATIAPAEAAAVWDPTALTLVPADHAPADPTEISAEMCPLHSASILVDGRFRQAPEEEVHGTQRLRMVFAVHDNLRSVKFALFVTYFGHVDLPAPLPKGQKGHKAGTGS